MAFESVRSYLQLASGLGEMTRARAMDAAQGLLALPGADEVTRRAVQATALADQILEAAKANRANLLTLVQAEVEAAVRRADVARVADVDAARAALAAVTKELSDLREMLLATGASAVAGAARAQHGGVRAGSAAVSTAVRDANLSGSAGLAPATRVAAQMDTTPTRTSTTARKRAAAGGTTTTSTARKSTKKSAASKTGASKTGASKTGAKKSAASKTGASKTAAKKSSASTSAASKTGATKTSTAKKATAKKGAGTTTGSSDE